MTDVGPHMLPLVMLFIALFLTLDTVVSAAISNRYNSFKIFKGVIILFIVAFSVLLFSDPEAMFYSAYYLVLAHSLLLLNDIYIVNVATSLLTPLQAKSYLPKNYSMDALAKVLGAFFAVELAFFQVEIGIGLLPIICLIVIYALVELTSRTFKKEISKHFVKTKEKGVFKELRKSFRFILKESALYKTLAIVMVLIIGAKILTNFKLKTVLGINFSEDSLTEILSTIFIIEAIITWILSVFFTKKVLFKFGVSNLMLFYPISIILILGIMVLFNMHVIAVIALYLIFGTSHVSYYHICEKQILSIAPKEINQSVFFIIRGLFFSLAYLIFSLVLLIYTFDISLEASLNTAVIFALLALAIYNIIYLRKHYSENLKNNLFRDDFFLKSRSIDLLAEKSSKGKGEIHLRRLLAMEGISQKIKASVMNSLGIIGNHQSIVDLVKVLKNDEHSKNQLAALNAINEIISNGKALDKYPVTKYLLLRTYEDLFLRNVPMYLKLEVIRGLKYFDLVDVIDFLETHLESDEEQIKINIIETFGSFDDRGIIPYLEPFLESSNIGVVRSCIVGLWKFEEMRVKLLPKVVNIIKCTGEDCIENALLLIESIDAHWEKKYVLRQTQNQDKHIRIHALVTLIKLGYLDKVDEFVNKMTALAHTGTYNEVEFALSRYRQLGEKTRNLIIHKIQQLEEKDVSALYDAFSDSKYTFEPELNALS
ncbi:hypothetical protein ACFL2V_04515 [Pseudomonadota bacterium]